MIKLQPGMLLITALLLIGLILISVAYQVGWLATHGFTLDSNLRLYDGIRMIVVWSLASPAWIPWMLAIFLTARSGNILSFFIVSTVTVIGVSIMVELGLTEGAQYYGGFLETIVWVLLQWVCAFPIGLLILGVGLAISRIFKGRQPDAE